jgi:hypothetical protein
MNRLFAIVLLLLMAASPCRGTTPALPVLPAVTLLAAGGDPLDAVQIGKEKGVLLVLISKGNPGGMKMLDFLANLEPQFPMDRLLIVVAGADEKVFKAVSGRYPQLVASWYRDPEGALAKKLKLAVTPVVLGVRDAKVFWNLFGVSDAELLEKTMRGWLNR